MKRKRILLPIDGTERSLHSIELIKSIYAKNQIDIIVMNVKELVFMNGMIIAEELKNTEDSANNILNEAAELLKGYSVKTYFTYGYASDEILRVAKEEYIDVIVMTKSTKKGLTRMLGSVTTNVMKKANCIVMIVPE
ncbi:MAG: universal stress protein [Clostridiales bacterium]|nr:universal stress protein [Clostridiales bacterium]MDY2730031.1 universal stress protein [Clostridium sp.]NLK22889.1 universal stress protein [Clostridiales bacterium]